MSPRVAGADFSGAKNAERHGVRTERGDGVENGGGNAAIAAAALIAEQAPRNDCAA